MEASYYISGTCKNYGTRRYKEIAVNMRHTFFIILFFIYNSTFSFEFTFNPIDAVIPCHPKDKRTIDLVVEGIRNNVKNIRRIIIVSAAPLTDRAEWFDEKQYPFTKESIAYE